MSTMSAYETLYNNMRNKFTVMNDNCACTLGEYMSMKANCKTNATNLPVAKDSSNSGFSGIFSYVNEKLKVKKVAVKDKTIRRFPLRTSLASCLCAAVACAFIFSFGIFTARTSNDLPATVEIEENSQQENAIYESND